VTSSSDRVPKVTPADTSVPIVVFMCDRDVLHHGALAIARSAGRLGVPVYGVHGDSWAPAALSRYNRGRLVCSRDMTDEQWVESLTALGARLERAILIPLDDRGAKLVDDHADSLNERFLFQRQPPGLVRTLSSKREMYELCQSLDLPAAAARFPASKEELLECVEATGFPAVLKRIEAWQPSREPAPNVAIANDKEQLERAYERMESPSGPNVMVQEHIPGDPQCCWLFNGYFDERSECLVGFTGKKIRQVGPNTGATTLGVCEPNETVDALTRRLMKNVGYRGILDLGFRYDARDQKYKLLDVNTRIGSTFRLFVDENGMDVLRALYLDLTGQPVPRAVSHNHRKWVVEHSDLLVSLQYARQGALDVGRWARSFRGVEEAAWLARDDPLPFAAMCARFLISAGRSSIAKSVSRTRR
jgi:D-aspartate ligase